MGEKIPSGSSIFYWWDKISFFLHFFALIMGSYDRLIDRSIDWDWWVCSRLIVDYVFNLFPDVFAVSLLLSHCHCVPAAVKFVQQAKLLRYFCGDLFRGGNGFSVTCVDWIFSLLLSAVYYFFRSLPLSKGQVDWCFVVFSLWTLDLVSFIFGAKRTGARISWEKIDSSNFPELLWRSGFSFVGAVISTNNIAVYSSTIFYERYGPINQLRNRFSWQRTVAPPRRGLVNQSIDRAL